MPGRVYNPIEARLVSLPSDAAAGAEAPLGVFAARCEADVIAWLFNRAGLYAGGGKTLRGRLTLNDLPVGNYDVIWWDAQRGAPLSRERRHHHDSETFEIETPEIRSDLAMILRAAE